MLSLLNKDGICRLKGHCTTCRNTSDAGIHWRAGLMKAFDVGEVNFECPAGLPWDFVLSQDRPEICKYMEPTGEIVKSSCCGSDEKITCRSSDCVADRLINDGSQFNLRSKCNAAACDFFEAEEIE